MVLHTLKKLGSKILDHVLSNIAWYLILSIIPTVGSLLVVFRAWLWTGQTIILPRGLWLLLGVGVAVSLVLTLRRPACFRRRLTNPADIRNAINEWLSNADRQIELPVAMDQQYYFSQVDRVLRIKRGAARRYLPMLARQHDYGLRSGARTFVLAKLSKANDVAAVVLEYLKAHARPDTKEVEIDCHLVAEKSGWPVEGVVQLFLEAKTQPFLGESTNDRKIDMVVVKGHKVILRASGQAAL
jgi:hypothetical protein